MRMRIVRLVMLDAGIIAASVWLVFLLRFDFQIPEMYVWMLPWAILIHIAVYAAFSFGFKVYNNIWRYTGMRELLQLLKVSVLTLVGVIVANVSTHAVIPSYRLPISIYFAAGYVFLGIVGLRMVKRLLNDGFETTGVKDAFEGNLLIVGAGKAGILVTKDIKHSRFKFMHPVAFIDDDASKQKLEVMGLPIVGNRNFIPEAVKQLDIAFIIIALPTAPHNDLMEIIEICKSTKAQIKLMPSMTEILDGKMAVNRIREVSVNDLLGRTPVEINTEEIRENLGSECILITGAGGSIGSELCRQLAAYRPKEMLLLGHGENSIYLIEQELRQLYPDQKIQPIIADIQDVSRIDSVFQNFRPTIVYHAAAHKHVPLMEMNPVEAVKNNVIGTRNVAEASAKYGAKRFILISSDKAVNPTSVMGATKRAAEMIINDQNSSSKTVFAAVRFGNVLGSRGSVIPLFKRQIESGGPVTVTHMDMVRYFMTIPEAVQLVIQASVLAQGGEVFVLDMGKPVRIYDLARDLIRLSGLEPDKDIPIVVTGIRPGEKLFEELLTEEEGLMVTNNYRIMISHPQSVSRSELNLVLGVLENLCKRYEFVPSSYQIKKLLKQLIPSYSGFQEEPQVATHELDRIKSEVHAGI
ncbi:polysaccharide biosynthesis protein [Paenibacillus pseudetheri]|uniref:UDP-N-acetyl-alpha-D-glucosamine C6 dehydratase n=1 Tax=Paenibacillus pseudetheri TaxID=2897682 RepID=A0ABM9BLB3_9BACL|nr:nucleoside-diphosphate sugar epimerase/dehydratase [Paenibacillus pseudetheri]CAH1059186.1 UDP-N-acetyl-alpha-D-glucosamine C6 dehydratase [Paenibacillus pseudetheri]